ncbi:MAG TPA: FAD-dependent oxidoreductase [Pseudonocardia sp.]|uniref:NAD(P)/FAD-dependent oxidoreductase n=1 Tax=Pseudonocardia sp. TaxID=60912 RepID=UPI002C80B4F4|nr:FAD-dependent oxidoreductase [Pseudonocardia sp.]HTF51427.1 FAD-dependent oxidoreductase [Pseudonocardia sp.]
MIGSVTVVGASLAGLSTARALRAQGYQGRLTVVGAEQHPPYDRPPLSKEYLAGTLDRAELDLLTPEDDALAADWLLGRTATGLDTDERAVVLDGGERLVSDAVVIATGARARQLPGPALAGVHTVRTVDDATALRAELVPGARLVLIGGGFIGAEIASTASDLGVDVVVVEAMGVPLAEPLGTEIGQACAALHAEHGVRLITGVPVQRVLGADGGAGRVRAVQLADGRELPADVVVVGIGATPCVEWLAGSGLAVDAVSGGVRTDAYCATEVPGVVAVGDCASAYRRCAGGPTRLEHWTNALKHPAAAAATLLGAPAAPSADHEVPYFWSDQYGARLQFAGHRLHGDQVEITEGDVDAGNFLAVYRRGGELVAVFAMNRPKPFVRWRRELASRATAAA